MEVNSEGAEPTPAASEAAIASVLGNDDLLREILARLGFPTRLVRAAAVSRRWLRDASDPAVLRRFRRLHPPRPLGFYVHASPLLRFVPLPQGSESEPEHAAVVRRGSFGSRDDVVTDVWDCRNGRLLVTFLDPAMQRKLAVRSPLHPQRGTAELPRIPDAVYGDLDFRSVHSQFRLLPEDGGDGMSSIEAIVMCNDRDRSVWVHLYHLQAGAWSECRTSNLIEIPEYIVCHKKSALLTYGKLYMICMGGHILGLDLPSMNLLYIKLPDGVGYSSKLGLSRAEHSGFFLIHVKEFQIHVWLYSTVCSSSGNWKLVDTISLHQAFGHLVDPTWYSRGADVRLAAVGDNADFVFLRIQHEIFYVHICSRTVEKIYELTREHGPLFRVYPLMMPWPPTFPVLNDRHDQMDEPTRVYVHNRTENFQLDQSFLLSAANSELC
ncbi:hypothetical protein ACP70R_005552 [Stipagrostis hirtigluma subsp. patula]